MPCQAVEKRCKMFENRRTDSDEAECEGRMLTATNSEITAHE